MIVVPLPGKLKQEDHCEFEDSLGPRERSFPKRKKRRKEEGRGKEEKKKGKEEREGERRERRDGER